MKKTKLNYPTKGAMKDKAYQLCIDKDDSVFNKIMHAFAWYQDQIEQDDFGEQLEGFLSQLHLAKQMRPDGSFSELVEEALDIHLETRFYYGHKKD